MRTQYWLSILLAAVGLAGMAWASSSIEPTKQKIVDLGPENSGKVVKVSGKVSDFGRVNSTAFFQLDDGSGKIDVVQFNSGLEDLEGNATVRGNIGIHSGELQIVAEEIQED